MTARPPASDVAVALAVEAIRQLGRDPEQFALVALRSDVLARKPDPYRWELEFKLWSTLPDERDGIVGKGGKVVVVVDTEHGDARVTHRD